jgi:hypothetical protein
MLSKSKIVLSLAIVLGTASAGLAATKHHPVRQQRASVERQVPAANSAYGYASPSSRVNGGGTSFESSGEGTIAN